MGQQQVVPRANHRPLEEVHVGTNVKTSPLQQIEGFLRLWSIGPGHFFDEVVEQVETVGTIAHPSRLDEGEVSQVGHWLTTTNPMDG